eukprot:CCRYP_011844-RA/>CCRYP_011844-RA protein AED:0.25 eAED:0.25 QI:0/-1/0/1/-1/1/1/0/495
MTSTSVVQNSNDNTKHRGTAWQNQSLLELLSICTIGSAVEYCWAAGEAVLVPYLMRHGVSQWVVSTIYLSNPTVGLWIQPQLGSWSDRLNRRVPFVLGLGTLACFGVLVLLCAVPLSKAFGFAGGDDEAFAAAVVAIAFLGFGIADICYDCLLIPGRALLDDLAVPAGRAEEANALFTGFQLSGRLLALLVVSSSITASGFWGLYQGEDAHFNAVLSSKVAYLIGTMALVLLLVIDRGSGPADTEGTNQQSAYHTEYYQHPSMQDNQLSSHVVEEAEYHSFSISSMQDEPFDDSSYYKHSSNAFYVCAYSPDATVLLCAVQAVGWTAITSQSFFWTSWRGEQVGSIDLALQGLVGIITSGLLPMANKQFGASTVWCGSELFFHLLMISVALVSVDTVAPRIISALCGINYAIHATNGLIVAADVVADPSKRARTIAMVNNALPMGQLVTALFGGTIAQYFGGFSYVFVCFGSVGFVVTSLVWIVSSRRGLFSVAP